MISVEYCQLMARYNSWQNTALVTAADGLTKAERWADQGAFFGSIAATLNHLVWADALMLARIKGNERPQDTITHSLIDPSQWSEFNDLRVRRDDEITQWAQGIAQSDLNGTLGWYPLDGTARMELPMAIGVVQLFNHQTHHRGQIHAMLTRAGAVTAPTDIPSMP